MYKRQVQSFPKGADVDPRAVHEAARQLAGYFEGCEILVCTHTDREHIHSHCIINSVNFETGRTVSYTHLDVYKRQVLGAVFTDLFQIHGAVMESSESLLYAGYQHLDLTRIFIASIFLGSSGAVMDLSVDICSAVDVYKRQHEDCL